jgi:hypothetical protein
MIKNKKSYTFDNISTNRKLKKPPQKQTKQIKEYTIKIMPFTYMFKNLQQHVW